MISEFFPVVELIDVPEEEEDDSFIVDDEPLDLSDEECSCLGPNVFEEAEEEEDEEYHKGFYQDFMDFLAEELFLVLI